MSKKRETKEEREARLRREAAERAKKLPRNLSQTPGDLNVNLRRMLQILDESPNPGER